LSLARVPLALAIPFVIKRHPTLALGLLGAAAATDVLDGFLARKLGQTTPIGAVADGVADKVLGCSVMVALSRAGLVSPTSALLLATRELLELPLAVRLGLSPAARAVNVDRSANRAGKIATTLELVAVVALMKRSRLAPLAIGACAAVGVLAGLTYWKRELDGAARAELRARRARRKVIVQHARADNDLELALVG